MMISIGGYTDSNDRSNKYSNLVANPAKITTFVSSVMAFLYQYDFDGLDIDWEYPSTTADKTGYSNLISALRTAFDTKGYLLSAAVPCNPTKVDNGLNIQLCKL